MISDSTFNLVSQSAHFFSGWAIVFTAALFFGHPWSWLIGWFLWSAFKEGTLDFLLESPDVRGSSLLDFGVSMLGGFFGLGLFFLHGRVG